MSKPVLHDFRLTGVARWLYLALAIAMAVMIFAGFYQTYPEAVMSSPPLPWLIHLHAAVFASWVLLIMGQPALVAGKSMRLHRRLGWVGAVLAGAMVILGFAAVIVALREHYVPSFLPRGIFVIGNLLSILSFGALVAGAIVNRRRPEWHKRLITTATTLILSQALGRLLPMASFGDAAPAVLFGVVTAFALIGPVVDLIVHGRIHPAYFWGLGVLLLFEILTPAIAFSPIAKPMIHLLGG